MDCACGSYTIACRLSCSNVQVDIAKVFHAVIDRLVPVGQHDDDRAGFGLTFKSVSLMVWIAANLVGSDVSLHGSCAVAYVGLVVTWIPLTLHTWRKLDTASCRSGSEVPANSPPEQPSLITRTTQLSRRAPTANLTPTRFQDARSRRVLDSTVDHNPGDSSQHSFSSPSSLSTSRRFPLSSKIHNVSKFRLPTRPPH